MSMDHDWRERSNQRRELRLEAELRVSTTTIDAVRDPVTREVCYVENDNDRALNVSRRGLRLQCERPPDVGTRLLLQIHDAPDSQPIEVVGRACWTRVEYERGESGARAFAAVGVEVLGGSPQALDRYARCVSRFATPEDRALAAKTTLG